MKIRTQFITGMIIFGFMVLIIAASFVNMNNQIIHINEQVEIARRIERGANELGYLSNDYFLYQESQKLDLWRSKISSITHDIATLSPSDDRGQILAANIEADMLRLNTVFTDVVAYLDNAPRDVNIRVDPEFQISWSRMAVQTQTLAFDAAQFSQILISQAGQAQQTNTLLIISLFGVFGVYFLTNYLIVYRRTLKSISELQVGTGIIGSGNFDFTIPKKSNDEIGELSQSFNQMTTNLKNVTASKTELEREVSERKRAEERLQKSNEQLAASEEELRSSNEELSSINEALLSTEEELKTARDHVQEYANSLETMVEVRTAKLRESEEKLRKAESVEAVGKLTAMLAHDLRNPLNFISQASEMARNQPEKAGRMLELIGESASRSLRMIENLRASTREIVLKKNDTDLAQLIGKIVEETRLPEKVKMEVVVGEGLESVSLDAGLIRRVLDNLVSNAVEVMPDGGLVTIRASSESGGVRIDVEDTGVGIADEVVPHIFESFYTTKPKGLGLGLPFSKRAVEAHSGTLTFTTRRGIGTTFTVMLPSLKAE